MGREQRRLLPSDTPIKSSSSNAKLPDWLYYEQGCCCSKAGLLWWLNVAACVFHLAFAVTTLVLANCDGFTDGCSGDINTPVLFVYGTNLSWAANTTNALRPEFVVSGDISLPWLTASFFFLSALAHGVVAGFNWKQAWASDDETRRVVTTWQGWYFVWMHQCRNPARWLEYSISASVMLIVIAISSGVAHVYMLVLIFCSSFATMTYGHFAEELHGRPKGRGDEKPLEWAQSNVFLRVYPNVLGWIPFGAVWGVLLHSFNSNTGDGGGPPMFVYVIVYGQFFAFLTFCVTQLVLLFRPNGPALYVWGEVSYLVLSFAAKGFLGVTLFASVIAFDSLEAALADARNATA
tara:strand:+ start:1826 stop:2872 length:1047 start_codon:yes stop_codon:yes gene_type:complete